MVEIKKKVGEFEILSLMDVWVYDYTAGKNICDDCCLDSQSHGMTNFLETITSSTSLSSSM